MIQIIGFLICACLAVKLLEMSANPAMLDGDKAKPPFLAALVIGWASVFGFALWLLVQGDAFPDPMKPGGLSYSEPSLTEAQITCIENAKTVDETLACTQ